MGVLKLTDVNIKGRRFLITQSSLRLLAGSEINTLEIADYLQSQGAIVTVYTYFFSEPISTHFHHKGIRVITDDSELALRDFDYVWIHHQVIPLSFISDIAKGSRRNMPAFIFLHMSGLETHFLEQAYIWGLEEKIASKVLFVSDETKDVINKISLDKSQLNEGFYRNLVPSKFVDIKHTPSKILHNILIVSNHPVEEVLEVVNALRDKGYNVVIAGEGQKEYKLIEPEYLDNFDVVVTIGKTVQYCLVENIPVFVYDVWGGPGYLNEANITLAKQRNFSGRGFNRRNAHTLTEEITNNYQDALRYQSEKHQTFIKEFSMDSVMPMIIASVKNRQIDPFNHYYKQFIVGILTMLKYKFYHENLLTIRDKENAQLSKENTENKQTIDEMNQKILKIRKETEDVYNSQAFRLGTAFLKPLRFVKRLFN